MAMDQTGLPPMGHPSMPPQYVPVTIGADGQLQPHGEYSQPLHQQPVPQPIPQPMQHQQAYAPYPPHYGHPPPGYAMHPSHSHMMYAPQVS